MIAEPVVKNQLLETTFEATPGKGVLQTRIESVDLLRGVVMVLMALDHVRDFFSNAQFSPLDLAVTTPALFLTRWVTHFCAPVFVLLAGAGAYLYGARGHTRGEVARFLFIRGLFLVALELTLVHFGWFFNFEYRFIMAQVIWMIGWSMVALAALVFLPTWAIAMIGIGMIAGHNLLDGISPADLGPLAWSWTVLHKGGLIDLAPGRQLFVLYPLVPWIGVMAAGYALGPMLLRERNERRRWLTGLGLGLTLAFVVLRVLNVYGDPVPWSPQWGPPQRDPTFTILSFINTEKYPPSLDFLLMTLGPALLALALLDRPVRPLGRPFAVFGRTPLFYYVVHLIFIHAVALVFAYLRYGEAGWLSGTDWMFRSGVPEGYGYSLPIVYAVWLGIVTALYPACRWFARLKASRRSGWLSYL